MKNDIFTAFKQKQMKLGVNNGTYNLYTNLEMYELVTHVNYLLFIQMYAMY